LRLNGRARFFPARDKVQVTINSSTLRRFAPLREINLTQRRKVAKEDESVTVKITA
jgi:hypothetical protein